MKIVSTEIFVLADPPPGPEEAAYQLPSPGAWPPRIQELPSFSMRALASRLTAFDDFAYGAARR